MAWLRAALAFLAAGAIGAALLSGGSAADPRTPAALPGLPPPFLGVAVVGDGNLTVAVDAYGDVVDMRLAPAGGALIDNPSSRQAAGSVPASTGIVPRVWLEGGAGSLPLWRADSIRQRYRAGAGVLITEARFGPARVTIAYAARGAVLACLTHADGARVSIQAGESGVAARLRCDDDVARRVVGSATRSDRHWLSRARPLGSGAPAWVVRMYGRSLLTLRALAGQRTGAVAAGARDGWAYVWPRDAGAAALAFAAAGYRPEARRIARFLLGLDLTAAARFHGDGSPVPGREVQGDAAGWVAAAARAVGLPSSTPMFSWRDRPDYQERDPGVYLGNAIASAAGRPEIPLHGEESARRHGVSRIADAFGTPEGLVRQAGDPDSGLDSAAAWAVRPFSQPTLHPAVRRTLLTLAHHRARFGITPGEAWGEADPWTAPTAWSAWGLATLATSAANSPVARRDRQAARRLLGALRRASTPAGALPERVDARTGVPRSTTPLAWSHAFAILALRRLWP